MAKQSTKQVQPNKKAWIVFMASLIVFHALVFVGWVLIERFAPRSALLRGGLIFSYPMGLAFIFKEFIPRLRPAATPPDSVQSKSRLVPASGTVIEIKMENIAEERNRDSRIARPRRYKMRVRISLPGQPDYETTISESFLPKKAPKVGEVLSVMVNPQMPNVVLYFKPKDRR